MSAASNMARSRRAVTVMATSCTRPWRVRPWLREHSAGGGGADGEAGCGRHAIADVSAVADPATGVAVYDTTPFNGQPGWFKVGGTSVSSPIIAAVIALAGNAGSYTNSFPYSHTASL